MRTAKTLIRLIWVFAGSTCHFVGFVMRRPNCKAYSERVLKELAPTKKSQSVFIGIYIATTMFTVLNKKNSLQAHLGLDWQRIFYITLSLAGWLGWAMVLSGFQCRGVLLRLHIVAQGPAVLAVGAGRVGYIFLFFIYLPFLMSCLLGDGWTWLKYCGFGC